MTLSLAVGLNQSLLRFPDAGFTLMPSIQQSGSQWVRADAPWFASGSWGGFETGTPGTYVPVSAAAVNALSAQAIQLNMKLLVTITVGTGGGQFTGQSVSQFTNMVTWLVGQCPRMTWEILNEPDNSGTSAALYTQLLQSVYPAMKAADPHCTVIGGVLSRIDSIGQTYWTACYTDGIKGNYDIVSGHSYPGSAGTAPPSTMLPNVTAFEALMAANTDSAPFWITEFGWSTANISAALQATYITSLLTSLQTMNIPVAMIFELAGAGFGISGSPAYTQVQELALVHRWTGTHGARQRKASS